jgi:hypothetical protein
MDIAKGDFQAPLSPTTGQFYANHPPTSSHPCGEMLSQQITDFYAWYMAWDSSLHTHAHHFQLLSQIKRIAQVSVEGGGFLSEQEEKKALERLNNLRSGLYDGNISQQEIKEHLAHIVDDLTTSNHKARLVSHTTELEYRLCIHPPKDQNPALTAVFKELLNQVIAQIQPNLHDQEAQSMDQGIAQMLRNLSTHVHIDQALRALLVSHR